MKILLLAIPFDNGKSGISVYIREVVKALECAGHELTLIVEDDGAKEFERFELIRIKKAVEEHFTSKGYNVMFCKWGGFHTYTNIEIDWRCKQNE
jgi:hypothetical protein